MGKGFGAEKSRQLGYVLQVLPEFGAFAGKFSLDGPSGRFIGIVNRLEDAQVWDSQKEAERDLVLYLEFLLEESEQRERHDVKLQRLMKLPDGELQVKSVQTINVAPLVGRSD